MPIDADAYMSGAIPTLSRGGSWVPPAHPGHPANGTANPTSTYLPAQTYKPSGIGDEVDGGNMNMMSSWGTPMFFPGSGGAGAVSANGSVRGGSMSAGQVMFPGWRSNVVGRTGVPERNAMGGSMLGLGQPSRGEGMTGMGIGSGVMSSGSEAGRVAASRAMSQVNRSTGMSGSTPNAMDGGKGGTGGVKQGLDIEHGIGRAQETAGIGKTSAIVGGIENSRNRGNTSVIPPKPATASFTHKRSHIRQMPSTAPTVVSRDMAYIQAAPSIRARSVQLPNLINNRRVHPVAKQTWEDGAGAPKLLPREPAYVSHKQPYISHATAAAIPVVHRKRADSLPRALAPGSEVIWAQTPVGESRVSSKLGLEGRKREKTGYEDRHEGSSAGVATEREHYERHPPKTVSIGDKDNREGRKPSLPRRHSEESLSPAPEKAAVDQPVNANSKTSNSPKSKKSPTSPPSPYIKLGSRPGLPRRYTHERFDISSGSEVSGTTSFYSKRTRHRSQPNLDSPNTAVNNAADPTSIHSAVHSPLSSPVQPRFPPSPAVVRNKSRFDLASLHSALPSEIPHRYQAPSFHTNGYIPPTSQEGYDRYEAHPAAPVPDRADRHLLNHFPPDNTATTSPIHPAPGMGGDTIMLSKGDTSHSGIAHGQEYLPVGYARPLADMEWNRDGPAMKTYGVAWKRHQEGMVLPEAPLGPRWEVAKPPRDSVVSSGGWWQSGGE